MSYTLLLYGATGYSGRLIAAEAARTGMNNSASVPGYRMVLAGRDGREVASLAQTHGMEPRVFGIEDRADVTRQLTDVDVVINAAGPFALTANHLAKGALAAGCHYVDINGEAEVYMKIDDLGRHATQRNLAMVASAGHTAAASDLLLHVALQELRGTKRVDDGNPIELGSVRIAASRFLSLSRGSLETLWRSLREQVRVVRIGVVDDLNGKPRKEHVLWHEPVGKLERTFDFFDPRNPADEARTKDGRKQDLRIASAANLVDTLTARLTVERERFWVHRIESYVEVGTVGRVGYQFGPLLAPLAAMSWARDLARLQLSTLPVGPTDQERKNETHFVVLEIEDPFQSRIVHWGWHTPNPYDFTAHVVLETAKRVALTTTYGWLTPSAILRPTKLDLSGRLPYLRGCQLSERRTAVAEVMR